MPEVTNFANTMSTHDFALPRYDGLSLLNVCHTIITLLGYRESGLTLLSGKLTNITSLASEIDRVVVVLSDGLSFKLLSQLVEEDLDVADQISIIGSDSDLLQITSVCPSTTVTALTTFWTGLSPIEHGILGTRLFFRELSLLGNLLDFPSTFGLHTDVLSERWGWQPANRDFNNTISEKLQSVNVNTHAIIPHTISSTGLTRLILRGARTVTNYYGTEAFEILRDALGATLDGKHFLYLYLPLVDTLSHKYGHTSKNVIKEIKWQLHNYTQVLDDPTIHNNRTIFFYLSDHGHHDVKHRLGVYDGDPLQLDPYLLCALGGESRFAYLYVKDGNKEMIKKEVSRIDSISHIDVSDAIRENLFGYGSPHPESVFRLGDLILSCDLEYYLDDNLPRYTGVSRHGGLSDWEILIPLLFCIR